MQDKSLHNKKGQILIEAIVAITVVVVGLLAIFTFISRSFSLNRVVADQYLGTYLAAEGIEVVKNLIDSGGAMSDGNYELNYNSAFLPAEFTVPSPLYFDNGYYSHNFGGKETGFMRKITINGSATDEVKVVSRVDWITRGGGKYNVELEDHFFNWKPEL